MDRGAWRARVHGVTKSQSDTTEQLKQNTPQIMQTGQAGVGTAAEACTHCC